MIIGIVLLAWSLYAYGLFSLQTESAQIQIPLLIRAVALGFIFVPLSTVSLLNIPKQKMAQASGLYNTMRYVGGSFGIAFFGSILTTRTNFSTQLYSQQINSNSAIFQNTLNQLSNFVAHSVGGSPEEVVSRAKALIELNLTSQSFIQGINDVYLFSAILLVTLVIPILFLKLSKKKLSEKIEIVE